MQGVSVLTRQKVFVVLVIGNLNIGLCTLII